MNTSWGHSYIDYCLFVVYYIPDSVVVDSRVSDYPNVYFKTTKSCVSLFSPSQLKLVCTPI